MRTGDHLAGQLPFDRIGAERKRDDPAGQNKADGGDVLTTITDERDAGYVHDKMEKLCYTSF